MLLRIFEHVRPAVLGERSRWLMLVGAQLLVCAVIFHRFFGGDRFLAYVDIGSDSFKAYVPYLMLWSNYLRDVGLAGWSFQIGLGGPVVPFWDPFSLISVLAGADHVLELRVWVMIARLLVAGWVVYAILRRLAVSADCAMIGGLLYSFCGYAQIDAQWDHMANELVFYPVLLLGMLHRVQGGNVFGLAGAVALCLVSNVFFVSLCVFAALVFAAAVLVADDRHAVVRLWLRRVVPPFVAGMALAAPVLIPYVYNLLDSPRVTGTQALFTERLAELFSINDPRLILVQLSGLFNKNLLGVGNAYSGWMNYLEGPGFYIGSLGTLLIPQLWRGGPRLRLALLVALAVIALYFVFPALRYAAYGFAIQYFRVSTLWITLLLLCLAVLALDLVLRQGINRGLLIGGAIFSVAVPLLLSRILPIVGSALASWLVFSTIAFILLYVASFGRLWGARLFWPLVLLVAVEASWTGYQSINAGRATVTAQMAGYSDAAKRTVAEIRRLDPGFYRMEKSYESVDDNDALAQNYFGVQSYAFHGSSVVRLHAGLGTIPTSSRVVNYTNWLPDFGHRFPLYSWVGVKYFLSRWPIAWPGFVEIGRLGDVVAYRNTLALPIGVMHYQQVAEAEFEQLSAFDRDRLLFAAAVTETRRAAVPVIPAHDAVGAGDPSSAITDYIDRARELQRNGLRLSQFEQNRLAGQVDVRQRGLLVYSIPFSSGWTARVDGKPVPVFRANLGFTALEMEPGQHQVELAFRPPGTVIGFVLAAIALCALVISGRLANRRRAGTKTDISWSAGSCNEIRE